MSSSFVITIDQGTTGSRVFLIGKKGEVLASAYEELPQIFPKPGWVEHDANVIWESVERLLEKVFSGRGYSPADAHAIGITNQRETTVLWEKATGKPVYNAIVWQCRRTSETCNALKADGHEKMVQEKTGLVIDPYFSATKIHWLLDNVEGLRERVEKGEILFGTMDSYLLYRLTGGRVHKTDYSNAARTMLFNIHEKKWDEQLLQLFGIPGEILPEVQKTASLFGETQGLSVLPDGIPVHSMIGDQQSALYGQLCHNSGEAKNTYGTGAFVVLNLGEKALVSQKGLLTTLACDAEGNPVYAMEGSIFIAGAALQWLRDGLGFFESTRETEQMAFSLEQDDDVVFVPALSGLGAPYWDPDARGAIFGLTRDTTKESIVRATLKSLALQTWDVLHAMEKESGIDLSVLKVDGGASKNAYLMEYQAAILERRVVRPRNVETTVLGAAYLAGLSSGFWNSAEELKQLNPPDAEFRPGLLTDEQRTHELEVWKRAIERTLTK